ncbi:unnamed protein product [Soboliphyme baturini]|uniref:Peptidase_M1_N domain-containing protein n=1 Tax=Soboliphyme baturini TaxID=241478 RepID=A0A183IDT8_9BILA|nr:unnamed protein product [Soboliphyme baturini]
MALPCFDAPNFKAQFDVTLVHPMDMIALSNQIVVSSQVSKVWAPPNAFNQTKFSTTAGPVALDYYAQQFDQPFPLKKQGYVACVL